MHRVIRGACAAALCALAIGASSGAFAQATTTTTTNVSNFEVLSVDGNYLVVRDQAGTRELNVPADFRFNVDGRSLAVGDLKPGMKGTATITKTTTVRPVVVTEIKKGKVLSQTGRSIIIEESTGKIHRFTQSEVDERGIQLFMGDKPVRVFNLDAGDQVSARIVTAGPPEVMTRQQVDAYLAQPPAPVAAPVEATVAADSQASPAAVEMAPEAAPEAAPAAETVQPAAAATPEHVSPFEDLPKPYFKHPFFWLLVLIIVVAFFWVIARRRVKKPLQ